MCYTRERYRKVTGVEEKVRIEEEAEKIVSD